MKGPTDSITVSFTANHLRQPQTSALHGHAADVHVEDKPTMWGWLGLLEGAGLGLGIWADRFAGVLAYMCYYELTLSTDA